MPATSNSSMPATNSACIHQRSGSRTGRLTGVPQLKSGLLHRNLNLWQVKPVICHCRSVQYSAFKKHSLVSWNSERWNHARCRASSKDGSGQNDDLPGSSTTGQGRNAKDSPTSSQPSPDTTASSSWTSESIDVETAQQLLEQEIAEQRALLQQQMQRIRTGQPLTSETSSSGNESSGQQQSKGPSIPWFKQPLLTWGLIACIWIVFLQSWWPMIETLISSGPSLSEKGLMLLGMSLLVPNSEPSISMQLVSE